MIRPSLFLLFAAALAPEAPAQCSLQTFTASDATPNDRFGTFALDGDRMLVGAPNQDQLGQNAGAAYFLERDPAGAWVEAQRLLASDGGAGDGFGVSVALLGELAVIGAMTDSPLGQFSGSAYVFERNALGQWIEIAKLTPSDGAAGHLFGSGVAFTAPDELWVGAPQWSQGSIAPGAIYIFQRMGGGWVESSRFTELNPQNGLRFGASLDRSLDRVAVLSAVVGAPEYSRTLVFERSGSSWSQSVVLAYPGGAFGDIEGDRMLVASPYLPVPFAFTGNARVLDLIGGVWTETALFEPEVPSQFGLLGLGKALQGDTLLLSSREGGGRIYSYELDSSGVWQERAAPDPPAGYIGIGQLGLAGERGLIGTDPGNFTDPGSVTEFLLEPAVESYCTSLPNSTGAAAQITASSCNRVSENAFTLSASPLPNQPGLFFYGAQQVQAPLGGGFRCVGGSLFRLPVQWAQNGLMERSVDLTAPPAAAGQITAGSSWNFQAWYRDPFAAATSNLTNAVTVRFL